MYGIYAGTSPEHVEDVLKLIHEICGEVAEKRHYPHSADHRNQRRFAVIRFIIGSVIFVQEINTVRNSYYHDQGWDQGI